jgi:DNA-binding NarL/FixJ family response regulator
MVCPECIVLPKPIRVLVVDHDPRVRTAIGQTIDREVDLLLVAEAEDAAAALLTAERAGSLVALVDVALPDSTTGLALVHTLAHRSGCAVVAMSIDGSQRASAMAEGAVQYVEKDGDIDAILAAVRSAFALDL